MTDIVNQWFQRFYPPANLEPDRLEFCGYSGVRRYYRDYHNVFPRMICADGFSMSVQGHSGAYSSPRDDFADSYATVEIGYPSAAEPLLMERAESPENPIETVYGYVPIATVLEIIEKHGGFDEAASLATVKETSQ